MFAVYCCYRLQIASARSKLAGYRGNEMLRSQMIAANGWCSRYNFFAKIVGVLRELVARLSGGPKLAGRDGRGHSVNKLKVSRYSFAQDLMVEHVQALG